MKPQSAKAKGRSLQQALRDGLRAIGTKFGLHPDDIESRGMGQAGVDIILSPAARAVFGPLGVECKRRETLNVQKEFFANAEKHEDMKPVLVHRQNRKPALVTVLMSDYLTLLDRSLQTNV
jgi:hypothetical protein